jgi:ribonuclease Z
LPGAVSWLVQSRLVNDPFGDPGLFVDFRFGSRALLFDLGDLGPLSSRELLRVSHVFVSHTHMDHFAGFDRLLRIRLHQDRPLVLVGPPGFIDRVAHKLGAYTWNLLDEESHDFTVVVHEFDGDAIVAAGRFRAREAFRRSDLARPPLPPGVVLEEPDFRIESAVLDHGIPTLAFALQETLRVNVWRQGLEQLGLPVGPWLNEAKRAVRAGLPDSHPVRVDAHRTIALAVLKEHAVRVAPGQRLAYVVDAAYSDRNIARITRLAHGADQLFIETPFLQEDAAIAAGRRHLTAAQAGNIARRAGVARLEPLHFSARYADRGDDLRREAQAALRGTVLGKPA